MDTLAALAFAGMIVAQLAAVIAASTLNKEDIGSEPHKTDKPQPSQPGFAARFGKHFDEEAEKLYRGLRLHPDGRRPRGFLAPFVVALARTLRPVRADHTAATVVPLAATDGPRVNSDERIAASAKMRAAA